VLRSLIAAPTGDVGAPRWPTAREYVRSVRLACSTSGFDRSEGPVGVCVEGARLAAAVIVDLIPAPTALVPSAVSAVLERPWSR
jgi:hypothetical protein